MRKAVQGKGGEQRADDVGVADAGSSSLRSNTLPGAKMQAAFSLGYACPMLRYSQLYAASCPDWPNAWSGVPLSIEILNNSLAELGDEFKPEPVMALRSGTARALSLHHQAQKLVVAGNKAWRTKHRAADLAEKHIWETITLDAAELMKDQQRLYRPLFQLGDSLGRCFLDMLKGTADDLHVISAVVDNSQLLDVTVVKQCPTLRRFISERAGLQDDHVYGVLGIVLDERSGAEGRSAQLAQTVNRLLRLYERCRLELGLADEPPHDDASSRNVYSRQVIVIQDAGPARILHKLGKLGRVAPWPVK
jgi:hypothetical protein